MTSRQITPETVPQLMKALGQLKAKGPVEVQSGGFVGEKTYFGRLAWTIGLYHNHLALICRIGNVELPSPITSEGTRPEMAHFELREGVVLITYQNRRGEGWRSFLPFGH